MLVTVITSTSVNEEAGTCGWAAICQSSRDTFRVGGRLLKMPDDASDAAVMAAVNGIYEALTSGVAAHGDSVIVGVEDVHALSLLAMCKGEVGHGSRTLRKAAQVLEGWRRDLGLAFEFRHAGNRQLFEGMEWQRNACENMARVAATREREAIQVPSAEQEPSMQMVA